MTLPALALILDEYDGSGNLITKGTALIAPSVELQDAADFAGIPPAPVTAAFRAGSSPLVRLVPTDATGPQPSGWGWVITFSGVPGNPAQRTVKAPAGPASFTATNATPAVFTWTPTTYLTSLPNGTGVQLSGGSLPAGFTAGTTYYVVGASGSTVQLAASQGGAALASTSTGSGQLTVVQYNLSALSPVSSVVSMAAFMPAPSGTAAAGMVPVATGSGNASVWSSDVMLDERGGTLG